MFGFGFGVYKNYDKYKSDKKIYIHPDLDFKIEIVFWGIIGKLKEIYKGTYIRDDGSRWKLTTPNGIAGFIQLLREEINKAPTRAGSITNMPMGSK